MAHSRFAYWHTQPFPNVPIFIPKATVVSKLQWTNLNILFNKNFSGPLARLWESKTFHNRYIKPALISYQRHARRLMVDLTAGTLTPALTLIDNMPRGTAADLQSLLIRFAILHNARADIYQKQNRLASLPSQLGISSPFQY